MIAWVDIETTDLDERTGHVLEIAVLATDDHLERVIEGPNLVVRPWSASDDAAPMSLERIRVSMPRVVVEMHEKSGLMDALKNIDFCVATEEAEQRCVDFFREVAVGDIGDIAYSSRGNSRTIDERLGVTPLAGSSVHFDRRWLRHHMPRLEALFSYRILDVSSIKECAQRWAPQVYESRPRDDKAHRALADVRHSVEELRHYRKHLFAKGVA